MISLWLEKSLRSKKNFIELNTINYYLYLGYTFLSLEDGTILNYKCDSYYNYKSESGLIYLKVELKLFF